MTQYDDLFLRDDLNDSGKIPSAAAVVYLSPDIVIWGTETIEDPQDYLSRNYGEAWFKNVQHRETNYIYGRVRNLGAKRQTGRMYLYYTLAGLITRVETWRNNVIPTSIPGQNYVNLYANRAGQNGDITPGDTAFQWRPNPPPQGEHYCLIARIETADNPNPLPQSFNTAEEYVRWVLYSPAVAWRNVTVISNNAPPQFEKSLVFENLDPVPHPYIFHLDAKNLPKDTRIAMQCGAAGPKPPIDAYRQTRNSEREFITHSSLLPDKFRATLEVTIKLPPNHRWAPGMTVSIQIHRLSDEGDSEWMRSIAVPAAELDPSNPELANSPDRLVRLGSYTILTDPH